MALPFPSECLISTEISVAPVSQMVHVVLRALILSFLTSVATVCGGILTIFIDKESKEKVIPRSLGVAAGVMIYVALLELMRESSESFNLDHNKTQSSMWSTAFFFFGMIFIAIVGAICDKATAYAQSLNQDPNFEDLEDRDYEVNTAARTGRATKRQSVFKNPPILSSTITTLAVALHNIPEGISLFIVAVQNPELGLPLAIAMAVHNVPEGVCIAMPIYFKSNSKVQAVSWALIAGAVEFAGSLIALSLPTQWFTPFFIGSTTALTAGMMVYASFTEVLAHARDHDPKDQSTSKFVFLGMFLMALSLILIEHARDVGRLV